MQVHARVDADAKEKKNAEADKRATAQKQAALTRRAKFLLSEMEKHGKKASGSSL